MANNGKFTRPALSAAEIEEVKEESNPIRHMIETCLEFSSGLQMTFEKLYELYLGVCEEDRVQYPIGRRKIRRVCREASPKLDRLKEIRINSQRGWIGVGISKWAHKKYLERL